MRSLNFLYIHNIRTYIPLVAVNDGRVCKKRDRLPVSFYACLYAHFAGFLLHEVGQCLCTIHALVSALDA